MGIIFQSLLCPGNRRYCVQLTGHDGNSMESFALHASPWPGPSALSKIKNEDKALRYGDKNNKHTNVINTTCVQNQPLLSKPT